MTLLEYYQQNSDNIKAIFFDIDGTLMLGATPIPGAKETLDFLRRNNVPFAMLTNNSMVSQQFKANQMCEAGIFARPEEIISCALALKPMAEQHRWLDKKFFLMGSVGQNPTYAELAGLTVTRDIKEIDQCFGIINGEGYFNWFHYFAATLNFFRRHPDAPYIVANPDSYWPDADDQYGIAAGGQARFICTLLNELGIKKEPVYLGKPYKIIYEYALAAVAEIHHLTAPIPPQMALMVGDSLKSDILGANRANFNSGLVLTGLTTEVEAMQAPGDFRPKQIFTSLI